ncbi:MAG: esterase-like activity of phytase family protein [Sphingomonas bacterium]|nr:esterase-like activity of phytase family protein [Sphingomonas bacterium]
MQPIFSKSFIFSSLVVSAATFGFQAWALRQPNRLPGAQVTVAGTAEKIGGARRGWRVWELSAPEPRFGGISALAIDHEGLVALTDSGVVIRFTPPDRAQQRVNFSLQDLPDGPGPAWRKSGRDSESLLKDPHGRGWWVGFETYHSLWRYDADFSHAVSHDWLAVDWRRNRGGEGLIAGGGGIWVLPESGGSAVAVGATSNLRDIPVGTSDATRLADGRMVLLVRRITWRGFATELLVAGRGRKPSLRLRLPLGAFDNPEAVAAAPLAGGGTRLWIATDDNFRPWMRTLLIALDLPPGA